MYQRRLHCLTKDATKFRFSVTNADKFLEVIIERLKLCRQVDCVNSCWATSGTPDANYLRVKTRDVPDFTIEFLEHTSTVEPVFLAVKDYRQKVATNFVSTDPQLAEEFYLYIHRLMFGPCLAKSRRATPLLSRLATIEAKIEALTEALTFDKK